MRESSNKNSSLLQLSGSPATVHVQPLIQIKWPPAQVLNNQVQLQLQPTPLPVPQPNGHSNETTPSRRDEDSKNNQRRFHCQFCEKDFQYSDLLGMHVNEMHRTDTAKPSADNNYNDQRSPHCQICGRNFKNLHSLRTHLNTVHKTELANPSVDHKHRDLFLKMLDYRCNQCQRLFWSAPGLACHMNTTHTTSIIPIYVARNSPIYSQGAKPEKAKLLPKLLPKILPKK